MRKVADATSVPFADSAMDTAASAPLPGLAVGNKPAPGQVGPKGISPRTNYSRVNTGSPQPVDAGVTSQKGAAPDSQNFLPPKIASEVYMSSTARKTIQEMIKAAAEGTLNQTSVAVEAERQQGAPVAKVASAELPMDVPSVPTDYVHKLANACDFMLGDWREKAAAELGPGTGPNALAVSQATSSNNEFTSGNQGQATPAHVPPKNPGTQKPSETPAGASNALEDNAAMKHKEQPVKLGGALRPASLALTGTKSAGVRDAAITALGTAKGLGKDLAAAHPQATKALKGVGTAAGGAAGGAAAIHLLGKGKKKEASAVHAWLLDWDARMSKKAEDAINPAQISAGAAVPPETSAAGEAGGAPAGGQPQGPTSLVGSNESAINYTKGTAKAPVKGQLASYLTEPALSAAHDSTLDKAFDHTGQAGVKISSLRAAAARAVLSKLSAAACPTGETKKKTSAGMSNFTAPPVSGAAAGPM